MAKLTLDVKNQTLTVHSDIEKIVEKSVNYLEYEVFTTDDWEGLSQKVIVTYNNGKRAEEHTEGLIKNQVIHSPGFTISVVGYEKEFFTDPLTGMETERTIRQITTNGVPIRVYPCGHTSGDDNPSEEPGPGFGKRLEEVEEAIVTICTKLPKIDENSEGIEILERQIDGIDNKISENNLKVAELERQIDGIDNKISENNLKVAELERQINNKVIITEIRENILYIDYQTNLKAEEE
jgi:hypothetical protein